MTLWKERLGSSKVKIIAMLAASFLFYSFYMLKYAHLNFGGNLSGFLFVGSAKIHCPDAWYPGLYVRGDEGYDGEFNYYAAVDPFLKKGIFSCAGGGPYRYQRILFPLSAAVLSGGQMNRVPCALLAINLFAVLMSVYFLARCAEHFDCPVWIGLFGAFSVGAMIALTRTTTDVCYTSLMIAGFYYYSARKDCFRSALWLSAAVLAKELALAGAAGMAVYELLGKKNLRNALWFLVPVAVYFAWQTVILAQFGMFSFQSGIEHGGFNLVKSLAGFFGRMREMFSSVERASVRQLFEPLLLTGILIASAAAFVNLPFRRETFRSPFHLIAPVYSASVLFAGFYPTSHIDYWGYGRHSMELFICCAFLYMSEKKWYFAAPVILNSLLCLGLFYLNVF